MDTAKELCRIVREIYQWAPSDWARPTDPDSTLPGWVKWVDSAGVNLANLAKLFEEHADKGAQRPPPLHAVRKRYETLYPRGATFDTSRVCMACSMPGAHDTRQHVGWVPVVCDAANRHTPIDADYRLTATSRPYLAWYPCRCGRGLAEKARPPSDRAWNARHPADGAAADAFLRQCREVVERMRQPAKADDNPMPQPAESLTADAVDRLMDRVRPEAAEARETFAADTR